jgi:hypothetical protein
VQEMIIPIFFFEYFPFSKALNDANELFVSRYLIAGDYVKVVVGEQVLSLSKTVFGFISLICSHA